jgi:hypothetical protein
LNRRALRPRLSLRSKEIIESSLKLRHIAAGQSVLGIKQEGLACFVEGKLPVPLDGASVIHLPSVLGPLHESCAQGEVSLGPARVSSGNEFGERVNPLNGTASLIEFDGTQFRRGRLTE